MSRLHPDARSASAARSFSAGSHASSNSDASYSSNPDAVHTPSTSPALSDRGAFSLDASSWNKLPRAYQPSSPTSAPPTDSKLSPLELLVKRGKQVQQDILEPSTHDASPDPTAHRIYERASALSRRTSVRRPPVQPSPDPDDFDDAQSIRSVNLLSEPGSSFSRNPRMYASTSQNSPPTPSSSGTCFTVQRGYKATYDDQYDSYSPMHASADEQPHSAHLLSNAFRNSVASDISFNSITGASLDTSLSRRASIDTVRSSEFGEDGRWGRAWASRADDEESAYEESVYGDELDDNAGPGSSHLPSRVAAYDIQLDPDQGPFASSGGLSSVAQQWKLNHAARDPSRSAGGTMRGMHASSTPAIREMPSKEKVVSLTRSIPPPRLLDQNQAGHWQRQSDPRHSFVPQIESHNGDAESSHHDAPQHVYDRTPVASADRYLGHRSTSSTATITGNDARESTGSPESARVYVYPPSPSGSEASRASGVHAHSSRDPNQRSQQRFSSMPDPTSARIETMSASSSPEHPSQQAGSGEMKRTPLAPSALLSNPRVASAGSLESRRLKPSGHPAGRAPPPPPPAAAWSSPSMGGGTPNGYSDPNQYFQGVDRPIIGRKRAEAIARADGRESMVSDLDVETLRLDGSSRRDSSSTIGSVMTSRMSIGSVAHDPLALQSASWQERSPVPPQVASPRTPGAPSMQAKASHASFRSLQPAQEAYSPVAGAGGPSRPSMLRNAKSSNALGSVDMQTSVSAPPVGLGVSGVSASQRPRTSPAVDTRTGPSSAEDFLSSGITHHEQGDLARSAFYFERSAKVDGGCVVGMCMFGMALREGWGARKDPAKGFTWIQKAAARAGEMMANTTTPKSDAELRAIKSELKLSVYELGKCFCYGWGVKMDKPMALEYFELAAKLGDADAQAEAGALYAAGKGCKKDLKKAAMYYRMAEQGGYDTVGLSWIHKDKYK
ncbi:hypothetical protein PANT_16d00046 [Moesziomyces antarcticus T-34]|uniref:HCP-like protein n=1 Tax=Pseudozyma antarctica (strain T-34) TaxID=1151754 RepID=M9LY43_PSEA3|nr:hypothetical protein PANT_16d00046 [Moesziomyces antarcticus T-34]